MAEVKKMNQPSKNNNHALFQFKKVDLESCIVPFLLKYHNNREAMKQSKNKNIVAGKQDARKLCGEVAARKNSQGKIRVKKFSEMVAERPVERTQMKSLSEVVAAPQPMAATEEPNMETTNAKTSYVIIKPRSVNCNHICSICKSIFVNGNDFQEHFTKQHQNIYECTTCNVRFNNLYISKRHMAEHHSPQPLAY